MLLGRLTLAQGDPVEESRFEEEQAKLQAERAAGPDVHDRSKAGFGHLGFS